MTTTLEAVAHDASTPDEPWLTASLRPVGSFGRSDVGRLRALLDALSASASIVVLDLAATRLRSPHAAEAIDEAARRLEGAGGCLLCVNVDAENRGHLAGCGSAVISNT